MQIQLTLSFQGQGPGLTTNTISHNRSAARGRFFEAERTQGKSSASLAKGSSRSRSQISVRSSFEAGCARA
jgi:hypothetical protein